MMLLTAILFLPLLGALAVALLPRSAAAHARVVAALVVVADLGLTILAFTRFDYGAGAPRFQIQDGPWTWVPALNIHYHLGVDGLSLPLVLLTGILGVAAVFASWHVSLRTKEYFVWLLVLQAAVMGVFTSLDFVLFFLMWELELLPMFLLISIWGTGRKEYSAMKFVVFTFLGSAFMLISIVALWLSTGSFSMVDYSTPGFVAATALVVPGALVWWFFFAGFAIKLPTVPLHTWLPDAHTDAPTAVSVMLAGVLLKMGGYGLIRINVGMFPGLAQGYAWAMVTLGAVGVLYGAVITIRQTDMKRLVAYSSVSHMGLVLIGVASVAAVAAAPVGLAGAAMQMFTHGTITGLLFAVVGLAYDRAHTRHIPELGGLATRMPVIATVFVGAGLASLGLPGLSGFAAEIMVFLGAFAVFPWIVGAAAFTVVLTAAYILWMTQRVFFGPAKERWAHLVDAAPVDLVAPVVLIIPIVVVGLFPQVLVKMFNAGLAPIVELLK